MLGSVIKLPRIPTDREKIKPEASPMRCLQRSCMTSNIIKYVQRSIYLIFKYL